MILLPSSFYGEKYFGTIYSAKKKAVQLQRVRTHPSLVQCVFFLHYTADHAFSSFPPPPAVPYLSHIPSPSLLSLDPQERGMFSGASYRASAPPAGQLQTQECSQPWEFCESCTPYDMPPLGSQLGFFCWNGLLLDTGGSQPAHGRTSNKQSIVCSAMWIIDVRVSTWEQRVLQSVKHVTCTTP